MTLLHGQHFNGQDSQSRPAQMELTDQGIMRFKDATGTLRSLYPHDRSVSPPMGNTPMRIRFGEGEQFVTEQIEDLQHYLAKHEEGRLERGVHHMEQRWRWVTVSLLVVVAFIWGIFQYGIPWTAQLVTAMLPTSADQHLGKQSLKLLDYLAFKKTHLSDKDQTHYQKLFQQTVATLPKREHLPYTLHFRSAPKIGANALALPSGDMIVTDAFIKLLKTDQEFQSVLAHEIGHIYQRHSVKLVVRSALLSLTASMLIGDPSSSFNDIAMSAGLMVQQLSYGRSFESQADQFAITFMKAQQIPASAFVNILSRLEQSHRVKKKEQQGLEYFSSHPLTSKRIAHIEQALGTH
ncbi:M48 family metallopeptidase [Magnetococcus sp. PR-3]|uniref:M48 family metallopeptidase n=1 Tax=Magnetococcus sp. PR-3 TaxID=3120355 RepID=UPI002FCE675B